ncbi:hypothetical protein SAMD00020551_3817 [Mesobacillus selenatarsenatis SF-1]|uniref:Uncharacterized protein n=1 Tax=Mesobacillus selenatarsenatis (strain DSM 18680 / JCM 14380 / FERM P-15431 / SF-1) TaxID=1321606 RepID=A0A0A8X6Q5_MESS1|nr:hypothetical protein SAMD00020551_3817 [Mesobacillus selenatarsenatis SF-1]
MQTEIVDSKKSKLKIAFKYIPITGKIPKQLDGNSIAPGMLFA